MSIIVIDFDGTYTADPELWDVFLVAARERGHKIICATMRHEDLEGDEVKEALADKVDKIIFTGREAKHSIVQTALLNDGYDLIDVVQRMIWIDDNPHWIHNPAG